MEQFFGIVSMIVGIAVLTLLIGQSEKTVEVLQGGSSALDRLLRTVTLQ